MNRLYAVHHPDQRPPMPQLPPSPFFYPSDEDGNEYTTPVGDTVFFVTVYIVVVLEIGGIWLAYHLLHAKGLL